MRAENCEGRECEVAGVAVGRLGVSALPSANGPRQPGYGEVRRKNSDRAEIGTTAEIWLPLVLRVGFTFDQAAGGARLVADWR